MNRNLGQTAIKRRRRSRDPMREFDALPPILRQWMANASMPWSPQSVRKAWSRAQAKGLNQTEALAFLSKCETNMLAKDSHAQRP